MHDAWLVTAFALFGKPAESTVCSECGADLGRRRSTRIGRRERGVRVLAVTVPMLLATGAWSGWVGWRQARTVDWNHYKPAWWLVSQANARDPGARDAALLELARRIGAGGLSGGRVDSLVGRALDLQADRGRAWVPAWGTLVEAAHDGGRISSEQWQRYMIQALTLVFEPVRSPIRRADELAFRVRAGADRVGTVNVTRGQGLEAMQIAIYAERPISIDGRAVEVTGGLGYLSRRLDTRTPPPVAAPGAIAGDPPTLPLLSAVTYAGPSRPTTAPSDETVIRVGPAPPEWLGDGAHTAKLKLHLVPLASAPDLSGGYPRVPAGPAWPVVMDVPWTVIPAARLNADPARRPAIEGALSVGGVRYYVTGRYRLIEGVLRCRGTPVALADGVYILCGEHEYKAGSACFVPGGFQTAVRFAAYFDSDEELPARVDIELRPEQARAPTDVTEIWGGVVTFNDVPMAAAGSATASPDPGQKGGN